MKRLGRIAAIMAIGILSMGALAGCGANLDREVPVQGMVMEVPADWLETIGAGNNDSRGTISFAEEDENRDEDETGNVIEVSYYRISGQVSQEETIDKTEGADGTASSHFTSKSSDAGQDASLATARASETQGESEIPQTNQGDALEDDSQETVIDDESLGKTANISPAPRTAAEAIAAKQSKLEKEHSVIAWSIDEEKTRVIDGAQVTSYEYSFVKEIAGERRKYEYKTIYVVTPAMMYEISIVGGAVSADALIDTIEL